ncbi:hypothetical protein DXG01_011115, partial [Tephrocybe rancida]
LPPGLTTRAANKSAHPAAAVGLAPKSRASREAAQEKHERAQQEKKDKDEREACARHNAAEIEDRLRREDIEREQIANHPPSSNSMPFQSPAVAPQKSGGTTQQSHSGQSAPIIIDDPNDTGDDSGQEYKPPPAPQDDEESDDLTVESEDEDIVQDQPAKQPGRKRKPRRNDISALRETDVASGTPGKRKAGTSPSPISDVRSSKKKRKGQSKAAFDSKWLETSKVRNAQAVTAAAEAKADDDSLVKIGGFIDDDEDNEVEKKASRVAGKKALKKEPDVSLPILAATSLTGVVYQAMVKIVPNKYVATKTEIRGGSRKWTLSHLPPDTSDKFTSEVVPLAKEKVGTLAPWASLTSAEIQAIVDTVYGPGAHIITGGDVWHGLISYRLQSWRNGFATAACHAVEDYFNDPDNQEVLRSAEARCVAVQWWLDYQGEEDGEETAPYQWLKCRDGKDGIRRKQ